MWKGDRRGVLNQLVVRVTVELAVRVHVEAAVASTAKSMATAAKRATSGSGDESQHSDERLVVGGDNSVSAMAEAWLDAEINTLRRAWLRMLVGLRSRPVWLRPRG